MKKTFIVFLSVLVFLASIQIPGTAAELLTFTVSQEEAHPGEEVTVRVSISNNPGFAVMSLKINYDANILEKVSFTGTGLSDITIGTSAVWVDEEGTTYNGDILLLTFKVKDNAVAGNSIISVDPIVGDINENPVSAIVADGGVNVVKESEPGSQLNLTISHSCSLGNNLSINYYIPASLLEGYSNVKLYAEKNRYNADGSSYTTEAFEITSYTFDTNTTGVERYRFVINNIAAKEIGDDIHVTVLAEKNGQTYSSAPDVYSVKRYAMNQLGKTSDTKLRTLLVDLLNYGAQAQIYFKYNTSNLANAELNATQMSWGTQILGELHSVESTVETAGATARFSSKSVVLDNEIVVKFYMIFDEDQPLDNVWAEFTYVTAAGTNTTAAFVANGFDYDAEKNRYAVRLKTIAAKDAGQVVTAKIYEGDILISDIFTYSIETYAYNQLQKEELSTSAKAIITAMMKYCKSAEAYFKK